MPRRQIGQETFEFGDAERMSSLNLIAQLIDWARPDAALRDVHAAGRGEPASARISEAST